MVNQTSSLAAALLDRAVSLDTTVNRISNRVLETDNDFSHARLEVVLRQRNDAWDAYWSHLNRCNIDRSARFVQADMHVLDYVLGFMAP